MDNSRYISLQYIKGDNYEKIQCFKYEEMMGLLDEVKEYHDFSLPIYDRFEYAIEDVKCPIGESFLNDLVNYYNFKDIKEKIEEVIKDIEYAGYVSKIDGYITTRTTIRRSLDELIKVIEKNVGINEDIGKHIKDNKKVFDIYDKFRNIAIKYELNIFELTAFNNNQQIDSVSNAEYQGIIDIFVEKIVTYDEYINLDNLKTLIIKQINVILIAKEGTKVDLIMSLKILKTVLLYEDNLDAIMLLLNKYIKICTMNMDKYERLFSKNDISNIDDIFMIKSYALFLNKLEELKKSLESKDKTKLERGLTNALQRLFDLYGTNDPALIINDQKSYIYEHISNI
uniref:Uncharacterized protein n=1 Tax=viral metagenome TaxID=1070528 RepID=A0A6C0LFH9_9ZZZZ